MFQREENLSLGRRAGSRLPTVDPSARAQAGCHVADVTTIGTAARGVQADRGIERDLPAVLAARPGGRRGFILIDALDQADSAAAARSLVSFRG